MLLARTVLLQLLWPYWRALQQTQPGTYYETIHRYETNRLRNIARFFGHLLASDSISWAGFSVIKMNEDDIVSSSCIFVKILLREVMEEVWMKKLVERFKDIAMKEEGWRTLDSCRN